MANRSSWVNDERDDFEENSGPESVYNTNTPQRVILLLDIDCFEVQVWIKKQMHVSDLDKPIVVTKPDGKIVCVNYTAKSLGVKRGEGPQWLKDARALCLQAGTELMEITPGQRYGKLDSFSPIIESNRILDAIFSWAKKKETKTNIEIKIERIFRDDFYIDLTDLVDKKINCLYENNPRHGNSIVNPSQEEINVLNRPKKHPCHAYDGAPTTCIEGRTRKIVGEELCSKVQELYKYPIDDLRLVHGALFADSIIQYIDKKTGYKVSAGVAHSKLVAKLACGMNKPRGITIIPDAAHPRLSKTIRFQDFPGFGGETGKDIQSWLSSKLGKNVTCIDDIHRAVCGGINLGAVFQELGFSDYEKKKADLYKKCQLEDESRVTSKVHPNTISTSFSFKEGGERKVDFDEGVWNISQDMEGRIDYYRRIYGRTAKELVVEFDPYANARTRTGPYKSAPRTTPQLVSQKWIRDWILESIPSNGLVWKNIWKIHLTARHITDEDLEEIRRLRYSQSRHYEFVMRTGYAVPVEYRY